MKKITKEQWQKFVSGNCDNSYSLAVCLSILNIWEAGCKTQEEAEKELHRCPMGLSGSQAGMAMSFALAHDAEEWLDKDMLEVSRV